MRISNANSLFTQLGSVEECYRIASEIGYDAIDLSVTDKWNVEVIANFSKETANTQKCFVSNQKNIV